MDPLALIARYYASLPGAHALLLRHSEMVARKALLIARIVAHLAPDKDFIREAALLHDIGIFMTHVPSLGCHGDRPYLCHGYLGRELLEREGLPRHALVAERHVGAGITASEIQARALPLPARDMVPQSVEEKIICYADKFFSKEGAPEAEKPLAVVRAMVRGYGPDKLRVFDGWVELFGGA